MIIVLPKISFKSKKNIGVKYAQICTYVQLLKKKSITGK